MYLPLGGYSLFQGSQAVLLHKACFRHACIQTSRIVRSSSSIRGAAMTARRELLQSRPHAQCLTGKDVFSEALLSYELHAAHHWTPFQSTIVTTSWTRARLSGGTMRDVAVKVACSVPHGTEYTQRISDQRTTNLYDVKTLIAHDVGSVVFALDVSHEQQCVPLPAM